MIDTNRCLTQHPNIYKVQLAYPLTPFTNPTDLLPSTPCQQPTRPLPYRPLSRLIQEQDRQSKRSRQKEMLGRNLTRCKHFLQLRDVEPEDSHHKREGDSGEEVQVLRGFVEGGWVLEDAEAAGADSHQAEPLPEVWC